MSDVDARPIEATAIPKAQAGIDSDEDQFVPFRGDCPYLSQIRAEMGLTQCDMAERLSVSQPTYAAYEKADNMRIGTLQKIVAALGGALSFHIEINGRDYSLQMPQQMAMA